MVAVAANVCKDGDRFVPMVQSYNPAPCCVGKVSWSPYVVYAKGQVGADYWFTKHNIRRLGPGAQVAGN